MKVLMSSLGLTLLTLSLGPLCHSPGSASSLHSDEDERRSLTHVVKRSAPHTAYACEDRQLVLECAASSVIKVTSANYGRTMRFICDPRVLGVNANVGSCSSNAKPRVATMCDGQRRCQFMASNGRFGDPCHGIYKFLEVYYTCESTASTAVQTAYACEGNDLVLECPVGRQLNVRSANYGRRTRDRCNPQVLGINTNFRTCTHNVVGPVFTQCDGQRRCQVPSSNGFGDPCPGIYKYLEANFTCD